MKEYLSLHQRIHNAVGSLECENIKAIHTYVHAKAMNIIEMETIWSIRPDITWAHSTGRMEGWDDVWLGTVTTYDAKCYERYIKLWPIYPNLIGGKDCRPLYEVSLHCLCSEVIEVADDGLSCTSLFFTPGFLYTVAGEGGKRYFRIIWERYGTDYVCDDGKWGLYHEQVCPDMFIFSDQINSAAMQYHSMADADGNHEIYNHTDPTPFTVRDDLHSDHTPFLVPLDTVLAPAPHATLPEQNMGNILPLSKRPKRNAPIGY